MNVDMRGLESLELLERQMQQKKNDDQNTNKLNEIKKKIEFLEARRDKLKAQVEKFNDHNRVEEPSALIRKQKLENLVMAHRLAGTSLSLKSNGQVIRLCFDTSYKGTYYEPYYAELQKKEDKYKIIRHTFPLFLPITDLQSVLSGSGGLQAFVDAVHLHLAAFVSRRQELEIAKRIPVVSAPSVEAAPACDLIVLPLLADFPTPLTLTLSYSSLTHTRPTKVKVNMEVDEDVSEEQCHDLMSSITACVKEKALSVALPEVVSMLESLPSS